MRELPVVAITTGEPAGIGPDLCAMLAHRHAREPFDARLVLIGDRALLAARAARLGLEVALPVLDGASRAPVHATPGLAGASRATDHAMRAPPLAVLDLPLAREVVPGRLDVGNAGYVRATLERGADGCMDGTFDALVTAPVQKSVLLDAGIDFPGHTEFFAMRSGTPRVVMMLAGIEGEAPLRVALVTTHLALADVPAAITPPAVGETLTIVDRELRARFGIAAPRIAVCGLNPHAGEGGHLGREEIEVIAPAIAAARAAGIDATGPWPADTIFVPRHARHHDAIVAMFHDQGLPVLKSVTFGDGINVTLGLPFIRTSVDHGTALDLARDAEAAKRADPGSLVAALALAIALARGRAGAPRDAPR